jgi:mycothiol synthase
LRARRYVHADLPALKAALATWIREAGWCGYCHPGDVEHRIYHEAPQQRDAHVWEDERGVAGIEITGRFGAVFDVFARPDCRGARELEMLRAAATRGSETDVSSGDDIRIDLLARIEFEQHRQWDHIRTRSLDDLPDLRLPPGFTLAEAQTVVRATIWFDDLNLVGLFEPVETHEDFRRLGLARAVITEGLHRMRAAGMRTARVEHDITNAPAAALYESLGFTVAFETLGFRRAAVATPDQSS